MANDLPMVGRALPTARIEAPVPAGSPPVQLHVPSAPHRPGDVPRFEPFPNAAGELPRPDTLAPSQALRPHAVGMLRVLDDSALAVGPWDPGLTPPQLRSGLEMMLRARHFDARMVTMQRQGRLSFYVTSTGEEAAAVASAMPYAHHDMLFPSYRQPGLMLVRGMPLLAMMCQCIGNRFDHTKGRQMPVHYSWKAGNVVSVSSPVGTQFPQAVGAAMAFAYRGQRRVAAAWIGDGTSAQGDFYYALNFASVYRPPSVLHVVNNQWAISTHWHLATGGPTFAGRAEAYDLPGLRVDGNDFLAVYAAEQWAVERARRGGGSTLIELVTYRRDAHSTSDDPSQYRAAEEAACWPGGDPVDRLKRHLILVGQWSEEAHHDLDCALQQEVAATFEHAESYGSLAGGIDQPLESLFEDVYSTLPPHLASQCNELRQQSVEEEADVPTVPFVDPDRRAAG
jgi:2-oxoisovalerate dehydrogenase E1 component alpha subunit